MEKKINNRYDVYALVADLTKELGMVEEVATAKPLQEQGLDSIDVVDMTMKLESQLGIENMVISCKHTPADVADNAWNILNPLTVEEIIARTEKE